MDIGIVLVIELLALGLATGFLAGLLGVGGGMTLVPFLTFILSNRGVEPGMAVKMAIATAMATIFFTSLSSVRAHHKRGAVRWDLARGLAPGIVGGSLLAGAGAFAVLKGHWLALLFALFIGVSATQIFRDGKPKASRVMPGVAGQLGAGGVIGFISGLLGAGGAFISVPFMVWCNVPPRQAVATSAALGFPIALANTTGYLISGRALEPALPGAFGYLYLPALVLISLASMVLAPLGARTAHRIDVTVLKRLFAVLLLVLAASMLRQAFAA